MDSYYSKKCGFVYFFKSSSGNYKIGKSKNPENRIVQLKGDPAIKLELVHRILTDDMTQLENFVHRAFSRPPHTRIEREWFQVDESHGDFGYFIGSERYDFWDDYLVDLKLIENNIEAYDRLITSYLKEGNGATSDETRRRFESQEDWVNYQINRFKTAFKNACE